MTRGAPLVVVRGGGDLATGVAARLQRAGFAVVVTELHRPLVLRRTVALAEAIHFLPGQTWVPLDDVLAQEAGLLAAKYRLRGADAVYAAVAQRSDAILITLDSQQLQRLSPVMDVRKPADALS